MKENFGERGNEDRVLGRILGCRRGEKAISLAVAFRMGKDRYIYVGEGQRKYHADYDRAAFLTCKARMRNLEFDFSVA